jgi:hypothetical protein
VTQADIVQSWLGRKAEMEDILSPYLRITGDGRRLQIDVLLGGITLERLEALVVALGASSVLIDCDIEHSINLFVYP